MGRKSAHEHFAAALHWSVLKLAELRSRFPTAAPRSCNPELAGRDHPVPHKEAGAAGQAATPDRRGVGRGD